MKITWIARLFGRKHPVDAFDDAVNALAEDEQRTKREMAMRDKARFLYNEMLDFAKPGDTFEYLGVRWVCVRVQKPEDVLYKGDLVDVSTPFMLADRRDGDGIKRSTFYPQDMPAAAAENERAKQAHLDQVQAIEMLEGLGYLVVPKGLEVTK